MQYLSLIIKHGLEVDPGSAYACLVKAYDCTLHISVVDYRLCLLVIMCLLVIFGVAGKEEEKVAEDTGRGSGGVWGVIGEDFGGGGAGGGEETGGGVGSCSSLGIGIQCWRGG